MRPKQYVQRGVKLLDQALPGWWRPGRIKLDVLDLSSCDLCILGQLYNGTPGGYMRGLNALHELAESGKLRLPDDPYISDYGGLGKRCGFDWNCEVGYETLTELWDAEIRARRRAARVKVDA